ncbi:hypothetical protein [Evansella halocellulosilytica]|uniref:hypothetical protein n=1 Tax=Evansella halocellulosilytica TaxID=2011013 RepID=UPI000BB81BF5|nr:hypothetical protein [Evansella halocellulosilytica]
MWIKYLIGISGIAISFYFVLLSLMNLFPKWIALPLLLSFILYTFQSYNRRHQFKGFHSLQQRK